MLIAPNLTVKFPTRMWVTILISNFFSQEKVHNSEKFLVFDSKLFSNVKRIELLNNDSNIATQ